MIGWLTDHAATILILDLLGAGIAIFIRGVSGSVRRYGLSDAVFGVLEVAFLIWLVTVLA